MDLVAGQTIRGAEGGAAASEAGAEFVFPAFETVEFGFLLDQSGEEVFYEGRDGGVLLGGEDAGAVVSALVHRNCDIFHSLTVASRGTLFQTFRLTFWKWR